MLSATVFAELKTVIEDAGATSLFTITSSPLKIKFNSNGNEIIFRGMDDENKLKSISGINLIWMEEADNFTIHDFLQANTRLRGKSDYIKQLFISFNPTSELSWLKPTFFDQDNPYEGKALVLETTYRDNLFLEKEDIEAMELSGRSDMNFMRVYLNGEWGRVSTDGLFYKNFNSFYHVRSDATYNPDLPVWLSFDFNVQPFCACTVWQVQPSGKALWLVDEITLKSPRNTTRYVCQEFKKRYPNHTAGVFVTGDPNGKKDDTRSEKGYNDYTIISNELYDYRSSNRVASKAPPIIPRGNFINVIFGEGYQGLSITLNTKCKHTIEDLTYQKEDIRTGKDKSKYKNKEGMIVERYGHCSDTVDYLVCTVFADYFKTFLTGNRKVNYLIGKVKTSARFRL